MKSGAMATILAAAIASLLAADAASAYCSPGIRESGDTIPIR
jgi:hypothetical protein